MPFDDIDECCIIKRKELPQKTTSFVDSDFSEVRKKIRFIEEFVKERTETIVEGTKGIAENFEILCGKQDELERRMSKIEMFSENTADELLKYYISILEVVDQNPENIRKTFIDDLGKNSVIILLEKIKGVVGDDVNDKTKKKLNTIIEILKNS